jgi:fucose 4-O-acetylase-like acetyltransferase
LSLAHVDHDRSTVRTAPHQRPEPHTTTSSAPPAQSRSRRDPYLDNAKFLAVLLVVVGHVWNNLSNLPVVEAGYLWLYLFHMPAFVLVTGYLSRRSTTVTPHRARQIVAGLVVPYLLFQAVYGVLGDVATIKSAEPGVLSPAWMMWFLAAVACWRLTAPLWERLRAPVAIAVLVSLVGGATTAGELALTQVLGLLPFFVLGLCLQPHHLTWLHSRAVRTAAGVALGAAAVASWVVVPVTEMQVEWVLWRTSYDQLGVGWLEGGLARLGLLLTGLVLAVALLALVPRRPMWFTPLGAHTMYAYLLHGLVVLAALALGVFDLPVVQTPVGVVVTTAVAAATGWALMTRPVRRVARPVVEPDLRWLWRSG